MSLYLDLSGLGYVQTAMEPLKKVWQYQLLKWYVIVNNYKTYNDYCPRKRVRNNFSMHLAFSHYCQIMSNMTADHLHFLGLDRLSVSSSRLQHWGSRSLRLSRRRAQTAMKCSCAGDNNAQTTKSSTTVNLQDLHTPSS